ncbi:N-acetylmuramoyl-L-alanine amidase [candidate division KSB1 bacterium]|nr:N-acetylmuramoyl-L-alanine amidase [candidate division KSB1 bacterium]
MILQIALIVAFLVCTVSASAQRITLVYPRVYAPGESFVYEDGLDSTFVLGNVQPAGGQLQVNGTIVALTPQGAFLAFLPLIHEEAGTKAWRLALIEQGGRVLDSLVLPYRYRSETTPTTAVVDTLSYPRVVVVVTPNAQTRTAIGGAYEFFPTLQTHLLAIRSIDGFFEFSVGRRTGYVDRRFVTVTSDSTLAPVVLGNGVCIGSDRSASASFDLSGPTLYRSELSSDRHDVVITLDNTVSFVDRIEYRNWDSGLLNVACIQQDGEVELRLSAREPIRRGYRVSLTPGKLEVMLDLQFAGERGKLRGKTIVIDAGHGGAAAGAIGPLGTNEKDVALRWSALIGEELARTGARVVQTRAADVDLSLYDRIDAARALNADCFVSLHVNALPDGQNPWRKHGSGTYYYQSESRRLAETIQREILDTGGLRDDGVYDANLAVVRPTEFPAVLIESAYLIHPAEEQLLLSDDYLRRLSRGVVRGLAAYFQAEKAEK